MASMDKKLLAQYLDSLRQRKFSIWHYRLLKFQIQPFLKWLSDQSLSLAQLSPQEVLAYLQNRQNPGVKSLTLRAALHALRDFLRRFAIPHGLLDQDPTLGISAGDLELSRQMLASGTPLRTLCKNPLYLGKYQLPLFAPFWEPYLEHLFHQRYPKHSLWHRLEHLSYFHQFLLTQNVRDVPQITARHIEAFFRYFARTFRRRRGRALTQPYRQCIDTSLQSFLAFAAALDGRSYPPEPRASDNRLLPNALLDHYDDFCRIHRGLAAVTSWNYRQTLLKFRTFLAHRHIARLTDITAAHLDSFLFRLAQRSTPRSVRAAATALRSFFRYLHLEERIKIPLYEGLLSPSIFRDDRRPKYIPWTLVLQVLASINRTSVLGKRDYAILSLLAHHGLRAQEIAALRLTDINGDLHAFTLRRRKNGEAARFPLAPTAEEALHDYLAVRAPSDAPEIFLTERSPLKPLDSRGISGIASRHLRRYIPNPGFPLGAHTLRHSFAKALLDQGATLFEVGALLSHKSLRSTLIYTRIHTQELREVADNYAAFFAPES